MPATRQREMARTEGGLVDKQAAEKAGGGWGGGLGEGWSRDRLAAEAGGLSSPLSCSLCLHLPFERGQGVGAGAAWENAI